MTGRLPKTDLHMHTTVSDGTDTPELIVKNVKAAGIGFFSVTDHDAVKTGSIIKSLLKDKDPVFIPGVEFSCRDEKGKYHVLGYGFDPENPALLEVVKHGHDLRMSKVTVRLDFLAKEFGFTFPDDEIKKLLSADNPGKPHIGNLMVKYGYAETKEQAIKEYVDKMRFKAGHISPEEAINGIIKGGGVAVLAHPFYGSGDEIIIGDEMDERMRRLVGMGIEGIEAFYSGFSAKLRRDALALAEKYDLLVTAGSDYHGSNKLVKLGDTGLHEDDETPERLLRFAERMNI